MFKNDFALAILLNKKIAKEESGVVEIPFGSEYGVRLKNKNANAIACDLYIDGRLSNQVGHILIVGNSFIDVYDFVDVNGKGKKLEFVKLKDVRVNEPNESENGIVEVRFYKSKEQIKFVPNTIVIDSYPVWPYRPWWYDCYKPYRTGPYWEPPYIICGSDGTGDCQFKVGDGVHVTSDSNSLASISNGATVEGRQSGVINRKVSSFELESEATILQIKLIGVVSKTKVEYCYDCGRKKREKENFCPSCGVKF